jgi:NAD-dependent DNA ligase
MTPTTEQQKIIDEVLYHRYLYYVLAEPEISDYQYDMLERQLPDEIREALGPGSSLPSSYPQYIIDRVEAR